MPTSPGWYRDGVTLGVVRWHDGTTWTTLTAPDPALVPAPAQPVPTPRSAAAAPPPASSGGSPGYAGAGQTFVPGAPTQASPNGAMANPYASAPLSHPDGAVPLACCPAAHPGSAAQSSASGPPYVQQPAPADRRGRAIFGIVAGLVGIVLCVLVLSATLV